MTSDLTLCVALLEKSVYKKKRQQQNWRYTQHQITDRWCPLQIYKKVRLSLHTSQVAHQARVNPGFSSMKRLGVFLLLPRWDAGPSQGYPQH